MSKHVDDIFNRVTKDLQTGIESAMLHLQQGMQEYLTNSIDLPKLLKMIEEMGIPNIIIMKDESIPGFDAYKILGLDKTATNEEVKHRFGELIFKLHPDTSDIKGTEFLTQMVVMAYQIIGKERVGMNHKNSH